MSLLVALEKVEAEQKLEKIVREHQLGRISRRSAMETLGLTKEQYEEKVKNYGERNGFEDTSRLVKGFDSSIFYGDYSNLIDRYNLRGAGLTRKIKKTIKHLIGDDIEKQIGNLFREDEDSDISKFKNLLNEIKQKKAMYAINKLRQYSVVFQNVPHLLFSDTPLDEVKPENRKKYAFEGKTYSQEHFKEEKKQLMNQEDAPHSFKQYFLRIENMFARDYNKLKKMIKDCPEINNYVKATEGMIFGYSFNDLNQDDKDYIYTYWRDAGQYAPRTNTIKKYHLRSNNVLQGVLDEQEGWVKVKRETEIAFA